MEKQILQDIINKLNYIKQGNEEMLRKFMICFEIIEKIQSSLSQLNLDSTLEKINHLLNNINLNTKILNEKINEAIATTLDKELSKLVELLMKEINHVLKEMNETFTNYKEILLNIKNKSKEIVPYTSKTSYKQW